MADAARYDIKIDLQGLIRLLAKNLYTETDVFVRELTQNAHDSIRRRSELEPNAPLGTIHIRIDALNGTIAFTDNGAGLTESEIHDYLSTIGRSGTDAFRQELMKKGRQAEVTLIGQFGIGLLSAFVVAYKVEVETLSLQSEQQAWHWTSEGQREYELASGTRTIIGTTVLLHISDTYRYVLNSDELRKSIKKYADFLPYQIFLNDERAPVNAVNAPWHLNFTSEYEKLQEYALFIARRFPDFILEVLPIELKDPYPVNGVLYITDRRTLDENATGLVDVYQNRMFVMSNNRTLLPPWARFMRGVIDSPALTLTASRDTIQMDGIAREITEALGNVIVRHLQGLAQSNPTHFEEIMKWHAFHIQNMALDYNDFFDAIAELIPFDTNRGPMNLQRYREQSLRIGNTGGYDIFYFRERSSAAQFYMLCNEKNLLVINAGSIFEDEFIEKYAQRHPDVRLHLISGAGGDILFERLTVDEMRAFQPLEAEFRKVVIQNMLNELRIVRFKPNTLPAVTILAGDANLQRELQEARSNIRLSGSLRVLAERLLKERRVPITIQLNADNPTIQQLAQMAANHMTHNEAYQVAIRAICSNAILLALHLITPEMAQAIFTSSNNTIKLLIDQTEQLQELQGRLSATQLALQAKEKQEMETAQREQITRSKHITCMVALPFNDNATFAYKSVLFPALRKVLEQHPYYWQVARADEKYYHSTVHANVARWLRQAHAYIADISDLNANVLLELGYMFWGKEPWQPVIVLQREQSNKVDLADLGGIIRITYPDVHNEHAVDDVATKLKAEFAKDQSIQKLNRMKEEHYLSPFLLEDKGARDEVAKSLTEHFPSIESFVQAESSHVKQLVRNVPPGLLEYLQGEMAKSLQEIKGHE
ncbi:hypothetical protein KSF_093470 [Reticulibacter mediterranei]|uniref:Molecular chaperone HtpG n=1 Tax=Reticulibacter mediterranei TaxID=2778369 RepID=A0A8J3IP47_9CHLR|nr:ATP-binding protein [Reticulibacter mediterranei]GHO99299.1 hypothetical protein KSF_093470 [Reticulibacter mediterranei]